jgi:EAL domain-containing protein (putative c-di-GMP-specific phosphodiesterase class I)
LNAPATLALIELENVDSVSAELSVSSLRLYLEEFQERVRALARNQDEVLDVKPHKICVLFKGIDDPQQLELAGAKLGRLFEAPIAILDQEIRANVVAAFVPPGNKPSSTKERLQVAEAGLREARREGKPYTILQEAKAEDSTNRIKIVREVEAAIEHGEMVLHYQPQIHAGYHNVVGAEALMRWQHPKHGLLSPDRFLPYATGPGMMRSLTWFALKSAISTCVRWPDSISVSVNVPPAILADAVLNDVIGDSLAIFGLAPERLTVEVTEDAMIADPAQTMERLSSLRDLGVRVAIDDFGTGYSSLSHLRDLPVDELKIDRSFVKNMQRDARDQDIVKAVVDLGHTFALKVVAEGVEDEATADTLRGLGCDILQGYLFGKPVSVKEFETQI